MERAGKGQAEVLRLVRRVRRRWRLGRALEGLAGSAALTGVVLFTSAAALQALRFTPAAVTWLRVAVWGTLAFTLGVWVLRPLVRRISDAQTARYLEEHEPTLEHAVVSALDARRAPGASPSLAARLVDDVLRAARRAGGGARVDQGRLYRGSGALIVLALGMLAAGVFGPEHLRTGLAALLVPIRDAATVNPYAVAVSPGDVTVPRGSDLIVGAELTGFTDDEASIFVRRGSSGAFQRLSMLPAEAGGFEIMLLGVEDRTEYFVEAGGVRSGTHVIEVADLPYVSSLRLIYHFPRYTQLPPRTVEPGGDVVALPGTVVEVVATPTMESGAGQIVVGDSVAGDLTVGHDGTLAGRFTVTDQGFYTLTLARDDGSFVEASPEYRIDLLEDLPPSIRVTEPGRDAQASPIEEVYLQFSAQDDYGVGDVRLAYAINGGPEDTLTLFRQGGAPLDEVSAGHTLYLEEFDLQPGDLISFYGMVRDNRTLGTARDVASDIFFITVRPFERAYREGQNQGGPPQGGGGQQPESALSELQRQIIAATFNLIRQRGTYAGDDFSENVVSVALAQGRLREQVATLLQRMQNRGLVETDPGFRDVAAVLPRAIEAMEEARVQLEEEELRDALPHEQTALRFLQQAEETFERYVSQQQQGGGGGGGQSSADDLADLFELELDKLQNQYETVRRGAQQQADDQVDEILERLRELSRRQEQEAERQRRRAQQAGQGAPQGGSATQRELAEEVEETARQLRRLARETGDPELDDTARRLEQAAEAMRRSSARSGEAGGQADAALERLEEARRRLQENRADRARRDAADALRQVDELARQQREVTGDVRDLPAGGQERQEALRRLRERKEQMTDAVAGLEQQLDRAAQGAATDQPEASRRLGAAAEQIRESKLKEKLQYSRGTIEQWDPASAATLELTIEGDLQALRDRLEEAAEAAGERTADPLDEALDEARELLRAMEAMDQRLQAAGQRPPEDGQGRGEEGARPPGGQREPEGDAGEPGGGQESPPGGAEGRASPEQGSEGARQGGGRAGEPSETPSRVAAGDPMGGGATRGDPRALTPEQIRQLRSEFRQRRGQARALRDRLDEAGRPAEELRAVVDAMARLEQEGVYQDPDQLADLQAQILEMLRQLEFGLRREVEGAAEERATLRGTEDVPEGYRALVEEYYKALARRGGGGR